MTNYPPNLLHLMNFYFSQTITDYLKVLLEEKHLYQCLHVEFPPFTKIYEEIQRKFQIENFHPNAKSDCHRIYLSANNFFWELPFTERKMRFAMPNQIDKVGVPGVIDINPSKTLHLFCNICNSKQPFNYLYGTHLSNHVSNESDFPY